MFLSDGDKEERSKEKVTVVEKGPFPRSEDGLPLEAWITDGILIQPQSK